MLDVIGTYSSYMRLRGGEGTCEHGGGHAEHEHASESEEQVCDKLE